MAMSLDGIEMAVWVKRVNNRAGALRIVLSSANEFSRMVSSLNSRILTTTFVVSVEDSSLASEADKHPTKRDQTDFGLERRSLDHRSRKRMAKYHFEDQGR